MKECSNESKSNQSDSKKQLISITDGSKIVWIRKDCANEYIANGFRSGLKPNTSNQKERFRKWVNKNGESFLVKSEFLDSYLRAGYTLGRAKTSQKDKSNDKEVVVSKESKKD